MTQSSARVAFWTARLPMAVVFREYGGLFLVLALLIYARAGAVTTPAGWVIYAVMLVMLLVGWRTAVTRA